MSNAKKTRMVSEQPTSIASHTPTPWQVEKVTQHGFAHFGPSNCSMSCQGVNAESNAAFIVRAVNSYDALKASNESLLATCKFVADKSNDPALVLVLDMAIDKAEGSQARGGK